MKRMIFAAMALCAGPVLADGHATGDAAAGADAIGQCKACHSIVDANGDTILRGGRNGPNLYGVFNRVAGSVEEFRYGKDLVAAGEAGLTWTEEDFVAFVSDPRAFTRTYLDDNRARSKMTYRVRDEQDARDVWAYLVSVGPAE